MKKKIVFYNLVLAVIACASFLLSVIMNAGTSLFLTDIASSKLLWVVFFDYLTLSSIVLLAASLIILFIFKLKQHIPGDKYIKYGYILLAIIMIAEFTIVCVSYHHENGFIDEELPSEFSVVLAPYKDKSMTNENSTFYYDDYEVLGNRYSYYSADVQYVGASTNVDYRVFSSTSPKRYYQFIGQSLDFQSHAGDWKKTDFGEYVIAQCSSSDGQLQEKNFAIYDNKSKIIILSILVDIDTDAASAVDNLIVNDDEIMERLINQFKEIGNDSPHQKTQGTVPRAGQIKAQ